MVMFVFQLFVGALLKLKTQHQEDPTSSTLIANKPTLLRSLFTVGALCRHFDFEQEEFKGANKVKCTFLNSVLGAAVEHVFTNDYYHLLLCCLDCH